MKKDYADMDPLEEIRAIREELNREFPTTKAYWEYLWQKYPNSVSPPPQQRGDRRTSTKPKASARPAMRQRKSTTHV